jgi:hypothetical protein
LNSVQHLRLQPAVSADGSNAVALQVRKSSLQTRTLWLPVVQGDFAGLCD